MEELETPTNNSNGDSAIFFDEIDSSCSTPYVSAPSSPGRGGPSPSFRFFYSAPASPVHFTLTSSPNSPSPPVSETSVSGSSEFEFSAKIATTSSASADELFLNGQIRPMKLQLEPLIDVDETEIDCENTVNEAEKEERRRDFSFRDRSIRRRTRSMSPLRTTSFEWCKSDQSEEIEIEIEQSGLGFGGDGESKPNEAASDEATSASGSSSRSSSAGRSANRWVFLKDLLYRSKSEGRNNGQKVWSSILFSPIKGTKFSTTTQPTTSSSDSINTSTSPATIESAKKVKQNVMEPRKKTVAGKVVNGVGKRPPSPHELHYTANRAQSEEMRKKTFLPYRQGLFGFLGFSSKSNGAINGGYARALNPMSVPSR